MTKWLTVVSGLAIITLAIWLRLTFAHTVQLYPDEFVTLLAVQMIGAHGTPTMPSGLFYEHGLLFSYLGYLATFLGEPRYMVRYLSLLCGLLTLGLTYVIGRRHFSPAVALIAMTGLALAPTAIEWSGRARMYALMQLFVLLTLWLAYEGVTKPRYRWLALLTYLGALLTHFVAITLTLPLFIAMVITPYRQKKLSLSYKSSGFWQTMTLGFIVIIAFMVKRLGQPKGIAAMDTPNAVSGVFDVLTIYSDFSPNPLAGWQDIAPFFMTMPALIFSLFAVGLIIQQLLLNLTSPVSKTYEVLTPTTYYSLILVLTTLEMMFLVSPERRDDKYLFMLLPILFLLGAAGMEALTQRFIKKPLELWSIIPCLLVGLITYPHINVLLENRGEDYDKAFAQVKANWHEGDTVLTGTPAAAYFYLQRNDFYSVQKQGGYDYRLLTVKGQAVDRWLASPAIRTQAELQEILAHSSVWLVLERWGLQREYYDLPFLQQLLAQTDLVGTSRGMFILRPKANPRPLSLEPQHPLNATFGDQLQLEGYTTQLIDNQTLYLTLYWRALVPLPQNYTVFVHFRNGSRNLAQADHVPLKDVYPMTIWPVGETIRERSELTLPADSPPGEVWIGLYLLETGERLPLQGDTTGENALKLP